MNGYPEYSGMSYEQASREGGRLVTEPCGWYTNWRRLETLRLIMDREYDRRARIVDGAGWAEAAFSDVMTISERVALYERAQSSAIGVFRY